MPASLTTFTNRILQGAAASLIVLALAGCSTTKDRMTTGSVPKLTKPVEEMDATELRSATDRLGQAYEKNPRDPVTGVNYANLLRMRSRRPRAPRLDRPASVLRPFVKIVVSG